MAGRPAGGNGPLYGLIAFAALTVVFLGLFIWQFTYNKDLQDQARRAQDAARKIGPPPSYYADEANSRGSSAMDVIASDLQELGKLVVGNPDALPPAIKAAADQALAAVAATGEVNAGDTLVTALRKLGDALQARQSRVAQLDTQVKELQAENERLASGIQVARTEFETQVKDLRGEFEQVQSTASEQVQQKDEQLALSEARFNQAAEELNRTRVDQQQSVRLHEVEVARLEKQLDDFRTQIEQLNPRGFDAADILQKSDGLVLRAIPGSEIVFINLGADSGVKPGLTFEVFAPGGQRSDQARGKASIEVASVGETTSECRVTRQTGPLIEGDIIVNVAYERGRRPKFAVRGEFDLDYNGAVDFDGLDRVKAVIANWGGDVVADVDETTDFLVVGLGPATPGGQRQENDISRDVIKSRLAELEEYRETIDRAQKLYVPVLTQSQFLYLTGYTSMDTTTAAR